MKKILIIGGVFALVGVAFYFMTSSSEDSGSHEAFMGDQQERVLDGQDGSLASTVDGIASYLKSGRSVVCTFNYLDEGAEVKGTVYVADKKLRGDYKATVPEFGTVTGNTIEDGEYMWTWGSMMEGGMKMKLDEEDKQKYQDSDSFDFEDENIEYDCKPWRADNSLFEPPRNIVFSEINTEFRPAGGMEVNVIKEQCKTCDYAEPGLGRDMCREANQCERYGY